MMSSAKTSLALLAFAFAASTTACATAPKADKEAALAAKEALKPASAEERAAANRADALTRANFWAKENLKDPEDLTVSLEFARALREIGSQDRALDILSQALIVHPDNPDALMLTGRIFMARGDEAKGDVVNAGRAFNRATEIAPERSETWAALGTTYDRQGQHRLAQTAYQKALTIEPTRTTTLTNYGLSLLLSNDLTGAEAKLRLAAANPDAGARVTENLALVLGLQGRFDEMKTLSEATAPDKVAEQNASLLRGLIQPARSWEALVEPQPQLAETPTAETPKAPLRLRN